MADLPSGTITLIFTDIEGCTRLWEQHPRAMPAALARHDTLLRQAIEAHGGTVFKTVGDARCAAFARAPAALTAALSAQRALVAERWGATGALRVRMALHSGSVEVRAGDYIGLPLSRVARLLAAGHGDRSERQLSRGAGRDLGPRSGIRWSGPTADCQTPAEGVAVPSGRQDPLAESPDRCHDQGDLR